MATKPATRSKPAARTQKPSTTSGSSRVKKQTGVEGISAKAAKPSTKPAAKPAAEKPAKKQEGGVTVQDLAKKLNRSEKSLRASIRRILGGAQVGKGGRYRWSSWDDKQLVALIADLTKADAE